MPVKDDSLFGPEGKPRPGQVKKALATLEAADRPLGALIRKVGPFRLELTVLHNPYRALARAIVYQQISGKAAFSIWERTRLRFQARMFPRPAQLLDAPDEALRACGLSRGKAKALKDLAARTLDGTVPTTAALRRLSDDEAVERLTQVHGVGVWTVQMMLIFRLGRADVMPSTDYGVRKGFGRIFNRGVLPTPSEVAERGERWRPYRSVASWYLWRALELP